MNAGRFLDLIEIDAASNTSVDDVRDLREKINFAPSQGKYKVYIIDEVHMLSTAAFNALLKTLEEPPAHAIFVLATTEIHKIPATVLSRCQRYEFRQIPLNYITAQLKSIAEAEKLEFEMDALTLIARQATGSMRDAISLLDQIASTGEKITLTLTEEILGTSSNEKVIEMVDALLKEAPDQAINAVHAALDSGTDGRQLSNQIVDYLREVMLIKIGNSKDVESTQEMKQTMQAHSKAISVDELAAWIRIFNQALHELGSRWQPSLALELAVVECLEKGDPSPKPAAQKSTAAPPTVKKSPQPAAHSGGEKKKPQEAQKPVVKEEKKKEPEAKVEKPAAQDKESVPEKKAVPSGTSSEAAIRENWKDIRALVRRKKPHTEALLNSCKSIHLTGNKLQLGFESDLIKTKMDTDVNRKITREAIQELLNIDVLVDCEVVKSRNGNHNNQPAGNHSSLVDAAISLGGEIITNKE